MNRLSAMRTAWLALVCLSCAPLPNEDIGERTRAQSAQLAAERGKMVRTEARRGADQLASGMRGVVAVLEFPIIVGPEDRGLSREISELVTTRLGGQRTFSVVERSQMSQLITERAYQIGKQGMTPGQAASLGRELNASVVVFGTIATDVTGVRMYVRAVDVASASVLGKYETPEGGR